MGANPHATTFSSYRDAARRVRRRELAVRLLAVPLAALLFFFLLRRFEIIFAATAVVARIAAVPMIFLRLVITGLLFLA